MGAACMLGWMVPGDAVGCDMGVYDEILVVCVRVHVRACLHAFVCVCVLQGSIKKLQIPTLPPKSSRSGVTFHFERQAWFNFDIRFSIFDCLEKSKKYFLHLHTLHFS